MAFSEAPHRGFSPGALLSASPASVNGSANKDKPKINAIPTLSNLIAELSLRTK